MSIPKTDEAHDNAKKQDDEKDYASASAHGHVDVDRLAEKIYELLKSELRVERERGAHSSDWER